jgi:hypothetical protein
MTVAMKLKWWLVVNLSAALTVFGVYSGHAANIINTDTTFLALGIVVAYSVMTVWIGWGAHRAHGWVYDPDTQLEWHNEDAVPEKWAAYLIGVFPALGLIGTLIGIVDLFAFGGGALENEAVYRGLGTALYVTLCGLVYAEFLMLQLKVLGRG